MDQYRAEILSIGDGYPTFQDIRRVSVDYILSLSKKESSSLIGELERGIALLDTHDQMCQYMYSFGNMHQAKLLDAFKNMDQQVFIEKIEIVDWGCGQALGTINLLDYILDRTGELNIGKVTLIEPSSKALQRGLVHVNAYLNEKVPIQTINQFFEDIDVNDLRSNSGSPVIHIFSNIIDVQKIDLKKLSQLLDASVSSICHIVCVGPLTPNHSRMDAFFKYFNVPLLYNYSNYNWTADNWTYKCLLYQLSPQQINRLIPVVYYPPVYFKAAYTLDVINVTREKHNEGLFDALCNFEVNAPFDLGASVYTDVHPLFAVLNNMICRGLPTKASPFIEEAFMNAFGRTNKEIQLGGIEYTPVLNLDRYSTLLKIVEHSEINWQEIDLISAQEILTPLAIARFQKVLIEAILTGHLMVESAEWKILVHERDVPFANLALKDFEQLFNHLASLSQEYSSIKLPKISLYVLSNAVFCNSPLHGNIKVYTEKNAELTHMTFDMVVDFATLTNSEIEKDEFSEYRCNNECYFKVQKPVKKIPITRNIYTSDLIGYKELITDNGEETTAIDDLNYFLQLLFRKETFRAGQLPILNRALQNKPVIGLLPTGGGKSLTYQLAALLQPGVTMVIDPLISLMLDQHEGLLNNGIDCCTFINSSITKDEKKYRELQLESSQLLIAFVSPERLSILAFRRRLRHMHDYNVYFSYAVIDEVHCVSEWGHDFRFSYLHLGRNLYNYVKSKEGHISLFGLTATASFDVLADVERELSGNGAFNLDPDTIVRYENTNRLELQFKVERVPVEFDRNRFFDPKNRLDSSFPKPLNINKHWAAYDSKKDYLAQYISKVPRYLNKLLTEENQNIIKEEFNKRQSTSIKFDEDLTPEHGFTLPTKAKTYNQAGIIFCPHRRSSGVSVDSIKRQLNPIIPNIESFVGGSDDMEPLHRFRNNKTPLMVATKAFGMGIDKPNIRYTINMNYSSSLESFVQEAGRAGRDKKMALAVILFAEYQLSRIKKNCPVKSFPVGMISGKWFHKHELNKIIDFYSLDIPEEYIEVVTAENDIVNLYCRKDNSMFARNKCDITCSLYSQCQLKKAPANLRYGWYVESDMVQELKSIDMGFLKSHLRYMSCDYSTNMYFYNSNFKGDIIEKTFMYKLLSVYELSYRVLVKEEFGFALSSPETTNGFLSAFISQEVGVEIIVRVPYGIETQDDISKAIYRLCCIELIEDFTQNYREQYFRIKLIRKENGSYFEGLRRFLMRYFTPKRAAVEIVKAKSYVVKIEEGEHPQVTEIHKCLGYLTEFIYDKISEKRKRAINDIRDFCLIGIDESINWIDRNEKLKDFIYYYFNSKYAKSDYVTESGLEYSLTNDTESGKESKIEILHKYLKVTDEDVVGISTPIDNIKHLQGAVRLIRRSLTDSNPVLSLLNAYTLFYIGIRNNEKQRIQASTDYVDGMLEFANRYNFDQSFWSMYKAYNERLSGILAHDEISALTDELKATLYSNRLNQIKESYLN